MINLDIVSVNYSMQALVLGAMITVVLNTPFQRNYGTTKQPKLHTYNKKEKREPNASMNIENRTHARKGKHVASATKFLLKKTLDARKDF